MRFEFGRRWEDCEDRQSSLPPIMATEFATPFLAHDRISHVECASVAEKKQTLGAMIEKSIVAIE